MAQPRLRLPFSGSKLWDLRERLGLSRPALAERCAEAGVSVTNQHLIRLEKGESTPSPKLLEAIVAALDGVSRRRNPDAGVKLDDLLEAEVA